MTQWVIRKWIQKWGIRQSWHPEFSSGQRPASKQPLLANKGDTDGWKGWDASKAQNQFLNSLVYKLILPLAFITMTMHGWGKVEYTTPSSTPASVSFPLQEDQEWLVRSSLLVWRPYQDDIDSGFTITAPSNTVSKDKTQNVNFDWGTGTRLTVGRYLPRHEQWDITLASTFFYSDTKSPIKGKGTPGASLTDLKLITEGWNPSLLGTSFRTDLNWRINYFTWDLAVGRLYALTPKIVIHPYLCLRGMLIYEKYINKNKSISINASHEMELRGSKFKAFNNVWGLGPRLGSDFSFYFGKGWSFMGSLSGSIVMGRYNIRETIDGFILVSSIGPAVSADLHLRDADTAMRANLEGNLGLGWEKWVRNHTLRIAPAFLFEVTQ